MKSLSLYVDKWFITVAVCIDGKVLPLSLPNGEDRIWLFFYEDIANERIIYGKTFENNYRDRLQHYYGDIFDLIASGNNYFTRYSNNSSEEMKEIFKASNIFSHLHQAIQDENSVDTYLSFSTDISDVARYKFIEELKEANFNVIESVARISYLALEECKKRKLFTSDGYYLALVATNDNMHYALYEHTNDIFLRKNEDTMEGLGLDVRRRALVESIVNNVNRTTKLLSTREDFANEYMRQDRFATQWLEKIANSRHNIPVPFPDITFAIAPNNPSSVTILPKELDDRTNNIVDNIVRKIADFVKNNQIQSHQINGIVFIGNTFTNQKFSTAINNRFIVADDKIVTYKETELPKVVNIYTQIDCTQFKEATDLFVENAKLQETLNQQAREEEERQKKAADESRKQQEIRDLQRKSEQEYQNAIENIERYENDHDYEQMIEWTEIALKHRPDDSFAKEKLALAQQLLAEERANSKQFSAVLLRAKTALTEKRWTDAISHCEIALELKPNALEVKQIKATANQELQNKEKITNYLNRADLFFHQKLYTEALNELEKVLSLEADNTDAKKLKHKISEIFSKQQEAITLLIQNLNDAQQNENLTDAVTVCEKLINEDSQNISRWVSKKEQLLSLQREIQEKNTKLETLKTQINKALFNDEWEKLSFLCENYLSITHDNDIAQILEKAQKRINEAKTKQVINEIAKTVNNLIADKQFNEAENEIKRFSQQYPSEQALVKDLRRKVFEAEMNNPKTQKSHNPIGFSNIASQGKNNSNFFGDTNATKKTVASSSPKKYSMDDFIFF